MIRHIVLMKFRSGIGQSDKDALYQKLEAIVSRMPGASNFCAGASVSPEGLEAGFVDGFTIEFSSEDDLEIYLKDGEHRAAGAQLVSMLEDGLGGLIVFDIQC